MCWEVTLCQRHRASLAANQTETFVREGTSHTVIQTPLSRQPETQHLLWHKERHLVQWELQYFVDYRDVTSHVLCKHLFCSWQKKSSIGFPCASIWASSYCCRTDSFLPLLKRENIHFNIYQRFAVHHCKMVKAVLWKTQTRATCKSWELLSGDTEVARHRPSTQNLGRNCPTSFVCLTCRYVLVKP